MQIPSPLPRSSPLHFSSEGGPDRPRRMFCPWILIAVVASMAVALPRSLSIYLHWRSSCNCINVGEIFVARYGALNCCGTKLQSAIRMSKRQISATFNKQKPSKHIRQPHCIARSHAGLRLKMRVTSYCTHEEGSRA